MLDGNRSADLSTQKVSGAAVGMDEASRISAQRYREPPGGDLSDEELLVDVDDDNDDVFSDRQHVIHDVKSNRNIPHHMAPAPTLATKKGETSSVKKVCWSLRYQYLLSMSIPK
mgnify:FL=1